MTISKADEIDAVRETLTKWEEVNDLKSEFFEKVDELCGFCQVYDCHGSAPNICPAKTICRESADDCLNIEIAIQKRIDKNIKFCKLRLRKLEAELDDN